MPKKSRSCKNDPDTFCYICGELTLLKYRRNLTDKIKRLYYPYFGCAVGDQDKVWSPQYCCLDCSGKPSKWFSGKKVYMGFAVPMIWREQRDHITDCYFCLTKTKGYNQRNRKKILYPNLPSAIRPVPHSADVCADLKVVALLRGLQLGYTKYCCFLCLWDSRARNKHYIEKIWPQRIEEVEGQHNVVALPLVPQNKKKCCSILKLHFHIKYC